jgi:hypothetical protein
MKNLSRRPDLDNQDHKFCEALIKKGWKGDWKPIEGCFMNLYLCPRGFILATAFFKDTKYKVFL